MTPVIGSSSGGLFYFLVSLVPCCPVCHPLPTLSTTVSFLPLLPPSPPRLLLVGFTATPRVAPPRDIPLDTTARRMRRAAYSSQPQPRATSAWTVRLLQVSPGTTSPHLLLQWTTARSQLQKPRGRVSVEPSMARNLSWSSTMHLCQVVRYPPGFGFS